MPIIPTVADVRDWAEELQAVERRIARRSQRRALRQPAAAYLRGLLSVVDRKYDRRLAESAGDENPYGVQHLLGRADWEADRVRDDLVAYVLGHPAALRDVLIVDETNFLLRTPSEHAMTWSPCRREHRQYAKERRYRRRSARPPQASSTTVVPRKGRPTGCGHRFWSE